MFILGVEFLTGGSSNTGLVGVGKSNVSVSFAVTLLLSHSTQEEISELTSGPRYPLYRHSCMQVGQMNHNASSLRPIITKENESVNLE